MSYVVTAKSMVQISQNFVAFSEYMNFIRMKILGSCKKLLTTNTQGEIINLLFLSMSQMLIRTNGVKDGFTIKEMNRTATLLLLSSFSIKDNRVTNHKHFLLCLPNLFQQKAQLCGILRQGWLKKWTEHFTQLHFMNLQLAGRVPQMHLFGGFFGPRPYYNLKTFIKKGVKVILSPLEVGHWVA